MARKFNFSAGPAMLPTAVIERAQAEMLDWNGSGMSVMEMSHRGKEYMSIAAKAEADLRDVLSIPDNYKVLFLQGGASSQFAAIPLNLMDDKTSADYLNTGMWSKKAIAEAKRYCTVNIAADTSGDGFTSVPTQAELKLNPDAAYVHYTPNETIGGVEFDYIPETNGVPLVADMSSTLLSRPLDVSRFGMIYAGAQKNIGPAGLCIVIIRDDLLSKASSICPTMFNYAIEAENGSMYNTPATYSWYMAGLVFAWIKEQGGLEAMGVVNKRKADKLYAVIDSGDFYGSPVAKNGRSWMNVPFTLADAELDAAFLKGATEKGLVTLKGHRSVGGMRASIYNAMPEAGVDALVAYMKEFQSMHS
ncbi:MAG: 3-phosphoserine/phosphohydroxythreonine transaminase [Mariprofundaceae bacterium]|nr:3-phosphoserine/phosphohydroxythreonine transaminase [Mariprofundaceae bacterium]